MPSIESFIRIIDKKLIEHAAFIRRTPFIFCKFEQSTPAINNSPIFVYCLRLSRATRVGQEKFFYNYGPYTSY